MGIGGGQCTCSFPGRQPAVLTAFPTVPRSLSSFLPASRKHLELSHYHPYPAPGLRGSHTPHPAPARRWVPRDEQPCGDSHLSHFPQGTLPPPAPCGGTIPAPS